MIFELCPEHRGGFFMLVDHAHEKAIDHISEKIGGANDTQSFKAKSRNHLLLQGNQFGEHVIRVQARTWIGGSTGGRQKGENLIYRIEG
jgi:hypothetical protein